MGFPRTPSFVRETALLDGQLVTGWRAEPRRVFWPVVLIPSVDDDWSQLQSRFWKGLRPNQYGLWTVTNTAPDGGSRSLRVRFVNDGDGVYTKDPSQRKFEVAGVELVADDPFWRGPQVSRTFQTAEDQLPFYATDSDRVFNLLSSSTTGSTSIENPGEVIAWPTIRIDGPATAFAISKRSGIGAGGTPNLSGDIEIAEGQWLIIDQRPTVQTAVLYPDLVDVTVELDRAMFFPVAPEASTDIEVELTGAGSLTVSFEPGYFRAF